MPKTSGEAYKNVRELGELFHGVNEIGGAIVRDLIHNHKKKKYMKQSLVRLIERRLIKEKNDRYILTLDGQKFFSKKQKTQMERRTWDGKWRVISFDVPGEYSRERDRIRRLLTYFEFRPLQKSVWVCPNSFAGEFWKILVDDELDKYCSVMLVEIIEGGEKLEKIFFGKK